MDTGPGGWALADQWQSLMTHQGGHLLSVPGQNGKEKVSSCFQNKKAPHVDPTWEIDRVDRSN